MEPTPIFHIYPPSINTILKRDNAFTLFRSLNTAVLNNYVQLKNSFRDGAHPSHEILNEFKKWKEPLQKTIDTQICKILHQTEMPEGMNQTMVISKIIQNYKEQQQFIEHFRNFTSTIQTIKDFIRIHALKDTSKQGSST